MEERATYPRVAGGTPNLNGVHNAVKGLCARASQLCWQHTKRAAILGALKAMRESLR